MATRIDIRGPILSGSEVPAAIAAASGDIELMVNSPGGELTGLAEIVAALHAWRSANPSARCTATVEALAASAAAYLLLMLPRGSKVRAYPLAMLMFHSSATLCMGGSGAMRDAAKYLAGLDTVLRSYLERTAVPDSLIDEWLSEGRQGWLNADNAMLYGIVDEIVDGEAELPPVPADSAEYRAVALFYPNNTNQEDPQMHKKKIDPPVAEMPGEETEKTEVVETTDGEKQVVETETEVKPAEEQPVAECEPKAEAPAAEPAPDLSEIVGSLTARVEELEKMLAASQNAQAKAEASLAALSGGLRGPATPKGEASAKPASWRAALKAVAQANPQMEQDDVFCEAARLYPELRAACISRVVPPTFNR